MAIQRQLRIASNIKPGSAPLASEITIAQALVDQLSIGVLLRGQNVPGGDALLSLDHPRRLRAEFKTLQVSSARAVERNLREASRQTGPYPSAVVLDARAVRTSFRDAERFIDRALGLVAARRPLLRLVLVITHNGIIERRLMR